LIGTVTQLQGESVPYRSTLLRRTKKKATYSNNKVLGNYNAVLAIDGSFFLSLWPWQKNNTPRFFFVGYLMMRRKENTHFCFKKNKNT